MAQAEADAQVWRDVRNAYNGFRYAVTHWNKYEYWPGRKFGDAVDRRTPQRSRSGTKTEEEDSKKQNKMGFNNGYSLVRRRARNTARKRMRHRRVKRVIAPYAMMAKVSTNFIVRNEMEYGRGRILLPNLVDGTSPQRTFLPMHIYSLDRTFMTGETTKQILFTTAYNNTTKAYSIMNSNNIWTKQTGDGEVTVSVGGSTDTYVRSSTSSTLMGALWKDCNEDPGVKRKWYQKAVEVDLLLYGQNNQDTLFRVDIVRFDPRFADNITGASVMDAVEFNQWMHSMIAPYTQNPTFKPRRVSKALTIVKSYKYKIPEQSADYDRQNCVKTRIVVPMNRVINRYWKKGADQAGADGYNPEAEGPMGDSGADAFSQYEAVGGDIHPAARYYMIIRATNTDTRTTGINKGFDALDYANSILVTPGQDPTYDIQLRSTYLVDL